jgi:hypothetical protein
VEGLVLVCFQVAHVVVSMIALGGLTGGCATELMSRATTGSSEDVSIANRAVPCRWLCQNLTG